MLFNRVVLVALVAPSYSGEADRDDLGQLVPKPHESEASQLVQRGIQQVSMPSSPLTTALTLGVGRQPTHAQSEAAAKQVATALESAVPEELAVALKSSSFNVRFAAKSILKGAVDILVLGSQQVSMPSGQLSTALTAAFKYTANDDQKKKAAEQVATALKSAMPKELEDALKSWNAQTDRQTDRPTVRLAARSILKGAVQYLIPVPDQVSKPSESPLRVALEILKGGHTATSAQKKKAAMEVAEATAFIIDLHQKKLALESANLTVPKDFSVEFAKALENANLKAPKELVVALKSHDSDIADVAKEILSLAAAELTEAIEAISSAADAP